MSVTVKCAKCGIPFCLTDRLEEVRREDHKTFWCPNGHPNCYLGKTEQEKRIDSLKDVVKRLQDSLTESYAQREDLVGALKECPVPGCKWHSRKQVPRDPVAMGRGIERVRADLLEHLVRDHSSRASELRALPAGVA